MGHLKIRLHYNALFSMVEKGFFDNSGEEEAKKIKGMDEERDAKNKIKRRQEINREAVLNKSKSQKTIFDAFAASRCTSSSEMTSSSTSSSDTE